MSRRHFLLQHQKKKTCDSIGDARQQSLNSGDPSTCLLPKYIIIKVIYKKLVRKNHLIKNIMLNLSGHSHLILSLYFNCRTSAQTQGIRTSIRYARPRRRRIHPVNSLLNPQLYSPEGLKISIIVLIMAH